MVYRLINHAECWLEHEKNSQIKSHIYKFFECSTNIPIGLSASKPQKLVVYCFHEFTGTINHSWLTNQSARIDLVII